MIEMEREQDLKKDSPTARCLKWRELAEASAAMQGAEGQVHEDRLHHMAQTLISVECRPLLTLSLLVAVKLRVLVVERRVEHH